MIEKTNKMQQMFIFSNISTCFGNHYAHLQENKTYYCMWCAALVLLDVVGSGCGAAHHANATTTNHIQQNQRSTPHAVIRLVLLKMGIMMPETC